MNPNTLLRTLLLTVGLSVSLSAQTALMEYKFANTSNTGSTGAGTGTLTTGATVGTTLGVSGAGDFSYSNTTAAGRLTIVGTPYGTDALTSYTLAGWFKTSSGTLGTSAARLLEVANTQNGGLVLRADNVLANRLVLTVNGQTATSGSSTILDTATTWTFFAVTVDSTRTADKNIVSFYIGSDSGAVSLVNTTLFTGTNLANSLFSLRASSSNDPLIIGNRAAGDRAFSGLIDDIRIFGATSGAAGALSLATLEGIRTADITSVPEPSAFGLCAGFLVLGTGMVRRRRRV